MARQSTTGRHLKMHQPLVFQDFTGGVWTAVEDSQIPANALADADNVKLPKSGKPLESRDGTALVFSYAYSGAINALGMLETTVVGIGSDGEVIRWSDGSPVVIAAPGVEDDRPVMEEFGSVSRAGGQGLVVADGGVLKVWRGTEVVDQLVRHTGYSDSTMTLADGSNTRVAQFLALPVFNDDDQAHTIETLTAWVRKVGDPGVSVCGFVVDPSGTVTSSVEEYSSGDFGSNFSGFEWTFSGVTVLPGQQYGFGVEAAGTGSSAEYYEVSVGAATGADGEGQAREYLGSWVDKSKTVVKMTVEPDWWDQRAYRVLTDQTGLMVDGITGATWESGSQLGLSYSRVALKTTLEDWWPSGGSNAEVVLTAFKAQLKAVGTPSGSVYGAVYDSDGTQVALGQAYDVEGIGSVAETVDLPFSTRWTMAPGETYYFSVDYASGAGGDYLEVGTTFDLSIGTLDKYGAAWERDTSIGTPMIQIGPGLAPRGTNLRVFADRLLVVEGEKFWYSNVLDPEDWSNAQGASGHIERAGTIVGLSPFYNDAVYLVEEAPNRLFKAAIDSIGSYGLVNWVVDESFPGLVNLARDAMRFVGMDILVPSPAGLVSVQAVETAGDLKQGIVSGPIANVYSSNVDDETQAAYYPSDQLYVMLFPASGDLWALDVARRAWFPWTFKAGTPTVIQQLGSELYLGTDDGSVYVFAADAYTDAGEQLEPYITTPETNHNDSFHSHLLKGWTVNAASLLGGTGLVEFFINNLNVAQDSVEFVIAVDPTATVDDLTMLVDEALFLLDDTYTTLRQWRTPRLRYKTLKVKVSFSAISHRLTFDGIRLESAQLGRRGD